MKLTVKRFFLFLMSLLMLLSTAMGAHAQERDGGGSPWGNYSPRVVKIAISDSEYFSKKQEDGTFTGINVEYFREIAKYAGWKLEYVECKMDELQEKFDSGEVDITGCVLKNEDTLGKYDFSDYSGGYSYTTLTVLKDNEKYRSMDYSSFNGMRVGVYTKSVNRIPAFKEFLTANNIFVTIRYYDDYEKFCQALGKGEVDAILSNDTSVADEERIIVRFNAVPYYFGVLKGRSDLLRELNRAMATILEVDLNFENNMYKKYLGLSGVEFTMSKEEEELVRTCGPLVIAAVTNLMPLESGDGQTGEIVGISPDVFQLISQITGLKFEYIPVNTRREATRLLLEGKADLITSVSGGNYDDADGKIVFTKAYLEASLIRVKNYSDEAGNTKVAALPLGYCYPALTKEDRVEYYDSAEACIQAVIKGEASYTLLNNFVVDHYTYLRGNSRISVMPVSNFSSDICIGVAQPANPALMSLIDKAVSSLSQDQIQAIVYENTTRDHPTDTLINLIYKSPMDFVLIAIGVFAFLMIVVVLLLLYMRIRLKLARQGALQAEAYRIIGELTDEYIYDFDFESKALVLPKSFARLLGCQERWTAEEIVKKNNKTLRTLLAIFEGTGSQNREMDEFQCVLQDGRTAWFRAVGTVLYGENKEPNRGIGKIVNIQNEKQELMVLESNANTDALTGLYNRRYCEKRIASFFDNNDRIESGALMVMDLDYLKQINDRLGHTAGDMVLKKLAKLLTTECRQDDIIGRWGGDEFIVFIPKVQNRREIEKLAARLCFAMNKRFEHEGKSCVPSISIGVSMVNEAVSYSQLFQKADSALYEVKRGARNGYKIK